VENGGRLAREASVAPGFRARRCGELGGEMPSP
jgi:hypothetical protein